MNAHFREARPYVGRFWYFIAFTAGIYWGISYVSGAVNPLLLIFGPPLISLFMAIVAMERLTKATLGSALALLMTFNFGLLLGYGVAGAGFIQFGYKNPPTHSTK